MSDVLSLVQMRSELVCGSEFSAPWSLGFKGPTAHFHIMERGSAWLSLEDGRSVRLEAGDLAILPLGAGHVLTNDRALQPVPIHQALAETGPRPGTVYRYGGGGEQVSMVCGRFSFTGILAPKLLQMLPALVHIEAQQGRPLEWLQLTSHFLVEETRHPKPGSEIMVAHLLDLLFIQAIREWGAKNPRNLGWLSGLVDGAIGRALSAVHERPAERWTVESLAGVAGSSRSAFAARFSELVGTSPLKYIASWRLDLAANHLRAGTKPIGQIAELVGYGSEAALTRAFKLQFGTTPALFRRTGTAPKLPTQERVPIRS